MDHTGHRRGDYGAIFRPTPWRTAIYSPQFSESHTVPLKVIQIRIYVYTLTLDKGLGIIEGNTQLLSTYQLPCDYYEV